MTDLLEFGAAGWGDELISGLYVTVVLAITTLPFGVIAGLLIGILRNKKNKILRGIGEIYATIFRSLPELLTLFIVYYGGQIMLQRLANYFYGDTYIEVNSFVAGVIALGLVFSAYASEVFLAAIRAINRGQIEAAEALGLKKTSIMLFITLPQLWQYALPGLGNLWLVLLKETSLVSIIALNDLMRETNIAVGSTKQPFLFYGIACLLYLIMSIISGFIIRWLELKTSDWKEVRAD